MQKPPHQFVPTLTHVVQSAMAPLAQTSLEAATDATATAQPTSTDALFSQIQQRVLQDVTDRVMRHIASSLERQVREAVATVALSHANAIAKELGPAIESVVTETLAQALQDALDKELSDKSGYR